MFGGDDEEELELLRMYDNEQEDGDSSNTSEGLDSDEENRILSALNYQSNFDTIKSSIQIAKRPSNQTTTYELEDGETMTTSSDDMEDEAESTSNGRTAVNSIEEAAKIVNFIDMNVQNGVQEKRKEKDSTVERVRKLQLLINDRIDQKSLGSRKPERLCMQCYFPGHIAIDCKRCNMCGGPKHATITCVGLEYCKRCKRRGHEARDCEERFRDRNCSICKSDYHRTQECPSLLHKYNDTVPAAVENVLSYCYICATTGHYGDECPKLPSKLSMCPTSFSKYNEGDLDRYSPAHMRLFSKQHQVESEKDRSISHIRRARSRSRSPSSTHSRRRHRSPSQSRSPRRRRSRSPRRRRSSSPKRNKKHRSRSRDRDRDRDRKDSSSRSKSHRKSERKDRSSSQSSKTSVKQSSSTPIENKIVHDMTLDRSTQNEKQNVTPIQNSDNLPSADNIICISDDDSNSREGSIELIGAERESSVDSRASSIERTRRIQAKKKKSKK